jgi:DNA-binding NarL/FixJ family response regulator
MKSLKIIMIIKNEHFSLALKTILIKKFNATILSEVRTIDEMIQLKNISEANLIIKDILRLEDILEIQKVVKKNKSAKLLAITSLEGAIFIKSIFKSGFSGCIYEYNVFNELQPAIKSIMAGIKYISK